MQIASLRYLLAVSDAGSFATAARRLGLHTSTLSRHIFAVEEKLGTTIFEREHSGVRLTSSGREILVHAQQALTEFEALIRTARSGDIGKQGRVRLGVHIPPISLPLRDLLVRWRQSHPDTELMFSEHPDDELCNAVRDRHLDAAFIAEQALTSDLVCEPMYSERLTIAVPSHSPLSQQTSTSWAALRQEPVLVQDWPQSHIKRAFYGELFGHGTRFQPHAVSKQSILALVAAGFGITLSTESQANAGFPGVTFILVGEENATINIVLAWPPQREDPAIGRFIAFMRDEARSLRSL
jgi:DNA-binding transcriptional LysR family regulator